MVTRSVLLATLALAAPAFADSYSCRAKVALNRVYDAKVDTATGEALVTNDAGTRVSGRATQTLSGRTGNTTYFLAAGFGAGVELEVPRGGHGDAALCLGENECYICREVP